MFKPSSYTLPPVPLSEKKIMEGTDCDKSALDNDDFN